jgi:protein transport protein SEC23
MVTQFKYSDNLVRTRVSTVTREYFREAQLKELVKTFDQEAAIVLLARMASYKADVEDCQEVKTWLDRTLLRFIIRFANYQKFDIHSFRLQPSMRLFPQFEYHLRRSSIINTFNCSPDESIFNRTCLMRECIANCLVMIQPALLMYTAENPKAQAIQLDIENMR